MLHVENETSFVFDVKKLEKIALALTCKDVELVLVNDETIAKLNFMHRKKNAPTDVLSFPLEDMPNAPLGSVVISVDTLQRVANELGHNEPDELALLFIHGLLHLLGYDHESDEGQMRAKEEELIREFSLPKSLIVRNT